METSLGKRIQCKKSFRDPRLAKKHETRRDCKKVDTPAFRIDNNKQINSESPRIPEESRIVN